MNGSENGLHIEIKDGPQKQPLMIPALVTLTFVLTMDQHNRVLSPRAVQRDLMPNPA